MTRLKAGAALLDIEGTIADIDFVRNTLFPYARQALPGFLARHGDEPAVRAELEATADAAELESDDSEAILRQLIAWIDDDVKATPLKALQGMIWADGYREGAFRGHLYPDARHWIERSDEQGVPLYIYSSGSVQAQQMYFAHSEFGDLRSRFRDFFDTTVGPKRQPDSYRRIADRIGLEPGRIVFFSDIGDELEAARAAGMQVVQLVRAGTSADPRFPQQTDFTAIELAIEVDQP